MHPLASADPLCDDPAMAEGPVITSRAGERQARLAFASYLPEDGYISEFTVTANADGLTATARVITPSGDGYGLPGFIRKLADDFREWEGVRSWRSLEDQLRVEATWRDGGHVSLRFHMTPSVYDNWTVSMNFTLEAGEELCRLGEDLASFMQG